MYSKLILKFSKLECETSTSHGFKVLETFEILETQGANFISRNEIEANLYHPCKQIKTYYYTKISNSVLCLRTLISEFSKSNLYIIFLILIVSFFADLWVKWKKERIRTGLIIIKSIINQYCFIYLSHESRFVWNLSNLFQRGKIFAKWGIIV